MGAITKNTLISPCKPHVLCYNAFSISGAAVSRHLSVLKEADLIRDEREGKFIYYELNTTVLEEIMLWITELKGGNDHDQTT